MTLPSPDETRGPAGMPASITVRSFPWPEIEAGDDLTARVAAIDDLADGDIVLVTSKVVSKAEGRLVTTSRDAAITAETRRVVARRGATVIAETRHGLVVAAAGVDASNTPRDTALTLPLDPDRSARDLRTGVLEATGRNVGVIITDTAGRAWRTGQTDLAIGCAGVPASLDHQGATDPHGNVLQVTAPAVADELAGAADLVKGKVSGRPVAVVRGLAALVLPPGTHGPGAAALVRPAVEDLFGLGAREAVTAAAFRADPSALEHFPGRSSVDADPFLGLLEGWREAHGEVVATVRVELDRGRCRHHTGSPTWSLTVDVPEGSSAACLLAVGRLLERADTLAAGWRLRGHGHATEVAAGSAAIARMCWQDR